MTSTGTSDTTAGSIYAAEYGKHPHTAVARMRWALALTDHLNAAAAA